MYSENKLKVLEQFFERPTHRFQLRELSRASDVSLPSVKNYIEEFMEQSLVERDEDGVYPGYSASMNQKFKLEKKLYTVRKLHKTGLIDKIVDEVTPDAVVLFGSAAKGEDIEQSDIDILAVSSEKQIHLEEFEEELNREINVTFVKTEELKKNEEFANSVANGIVLDGYLVVR